ncbi:uncharacterized protein LOC119992950 isoform X3 [Tripterygium wilfordii]|uniref:uncharacterized protein LOC119992950 isoform X3 n=1 Tax=Tripterygium wilfordii TaxID=458696 RepID=UPI0018F845EA|nr:uncharacterized protein LOC119992950 isoform X3 [Tripterygium wilfordii]
MGAIGISTKLNTAHNLYLQVRFGISKLLLLVGTKRRVPREAIIYICMLLSSQDLRSDAHRMMPYVMVPDKLNSNPCSQGYADRENSFPALLSGPQSLSPCDFQEFLNPKLFCATAKLPVDGGNVTANTVGSGISVISGGLISENPSYRSLENGMNRYPVFSSSAMMSPDCGNNSVGYDGLCSVNSNFQNLDLVKAIIHHATPTEGRVNTISSLVDQWHVTTASSAVKHRSGKILGLQKLPLEADPMFSHKYSPLTDGCPRVYCLNTSGYLLLSNTGMLGIVCSCHFFQMSVSNFCEHSGLRDVSPGNVVRMHTGETIARWRKLYFQKFGIRAPEDRSGWEWPEGFSLTAGLMKSGEIVPYISKNSDRVQVVGSSGGLMTSGPHLDNVTFPKNSHTDQNFIIDASHDMQRIKALDDNKFLLKGFGSASPSNLHSEAHVQVMECPASWCSMKTEFVGSDSNRKRQFTSSQGDSVLKIANSSIVDPILQIAVKSSHTGRLIHARDGTATDRDAASNIELRLGQPYQQNQPSRNSLPSSFGAQQYEATVDPQKSLPPAINCGDREEFGKYLPSFAGMSDITMRRVQVPSDILNSEIGTSDGLDATKLEKFEGYVAVNSVVPLFTNRTPLEGSMLSTFPNDTVDNGHHRIANTLCYDSRTMKSGVLNVPWHGDSGLERQLNANVFKIGCFRHPDKVKGVDYVAVSSHAATNVDSRVNRQMGNPMSLTGVAGGKCYPSFSVAHAENHFKNYFSHVPPKASEPITFANHPENVPSIDSCEHIDHGFLGSMGSPTGSRKFLPSEIVARGNDSDVGLTPAVSKQGSAGVCPYMLDENMRLLALGQILKLSRQHHVISSLGMDQEHGGVGSSSTVEVGHSVTRSAREQDAHVYNITSEQDAHVSPKLMQFSATGGMDGNYECCRNNMSQSKEIGNCCSRAPCMYLQSCRYAAHKKCYGGNCDSSVGSSYDTYKEHFAYVGDKASVPVASKFVCEHTVSREKVTYLDQNGKSDLQQPESKNSHPQWRDVPSKVKRTCEVTAMEKSAAFLGEKGDIDTEVWDTSVVCSKEAAPLADSLKNQEVSYFSSECSAPVVHQVTTEVNNMDSSVVGEESGCVNSFVVRESLVIDKCGSSSDGAFESKRSAECYFSNCKTNPKREGSDKVPGNQSSRSLVDELKLMDSLLWKKGQNEMHIGVITHRESNNLQKNEAALESGKKKRPEKLKNVDSYFCTAGLPKAHDRYDGCAETAGSSSSLSINAQMLPIPGEDMFGACSAQHKSKLGRSFSPLVKAHSRKRDLLNLYDDRNEDNGYERQLDGRVDFQGIFEGSGNKKSRNDGTWDASGLIWKQSAGGDKKAASYPTSGKTESFCQSVDVKYRKEMPVVCGKYGEICSRSLATTLKPVKILSLSRILKTARKCTLPTSSTSRLTSLGDLKKRSFTRRNRRFYELSNVKNDEEIGNHNSIVSDMSLEASEKERGWACTSGDRQFNDKFFTVDENQDDKSKKYCDVTDSQPKPKCKEIRKRSLYDLSLRGNDSSEISSHKKVSCAFRIERDKHLKNAGDIKSCLVGTSKFKMKSRSAQEHKHVPLRNSDALCCVCGSSSEDEVNCLVECSQCLIRVHRACYGISRIPKSGWCCRPCRTSSENITCVLCGYGGGAMTQAVGSRAIVKSLLKAWNIETEPVKRNCFKEMSQEGGNMFHSSGYLVEIDSYPVLRLVDIEPATTTLRNIDMQKQLDIVQNSLRCVNNLEVHNSITAGVFDSAVKQWVHMVCGLWTPGTRCPNVDTMSTFDVSGAPHCNAMCSICNRPGGSCIQCRVVNCSVQFHPWCAHREGLLQSEVEGIYNENVGFYGSCVLHARASMSEPGSDITYNEAGCPREKEPSCARTEGYKGCKRDGFWRNFYKKETGGCLVPQEQLDAWTYINKLKSCIQGLIKPPVSDIEYDCRKEYAHYKQAKGWKHLVVYKSGIHALGLYTSRFISRGEMVVEYVGEVVGVRVADKRENDYQSGRKLQYKSACYFFKIDKEHIIDATRKGGIARFVNHSCLPNCIAKVISMKTERKVVFFADRDIFPGEEITYDYHFNHEDEGKKIPCFCSSENCRRYLN